LIRAITKLVNLCWRLEYLPKQFRKARTIVLRKPNKDDYSIPGAWRPIALLNTLGKVVESLAARQLRDLAEQYHLLPNTQMGKRPNRSTETALELLIEQIHTVWGPNRHIASVLSLDISGAFDTVNHLRLLDNLRKKGVPLWFVRTIRSFLTDRTTTLMVDGEETPERQLLAGVPQGSPLSPILFLFYNAPLLEALKLPEQQVSPVGFADDVSLLTYGESTIQNCTALELAHEKCLEWAYTHGMRFAPDKYTLTHFTRRRNFDLSQPIRLAGVEINPTPSIKILGLN
jgi:retron-type reverse transcriptase